jgi:hypothetical protein
VEVRLKKYFTYSKNKKKNEYQAAHSRIYPENYKRTAPVFGEIHG